ncbi:MAG: ATPase [Bacteroidetes bacterium]|nr:ATPase [Bacteroidota bacterium]
MNWLMEKKKITGQTKSAGFQIGVRKTFNVSAGSAWDFLFSGKGLSTWLGNIDPEGFELNKPYKTKEGIEGKVNVFKPYSHIRLSWKPKSWTNISALQIRVIEAKDKATISFHQDKLLDSRQREEMKTHWDRVIMKIAGELNL